jgi:phytoene synthase
MARGEPLTAAAQLVRRHDRDRFLTALFAPPAQREALYALYAFNYEIARVREIVSEPMLGRMRLQWWRESIAAIFEGAPIRHHEVVAPLAQAIVQRGLSRAHFDMIIEAREADLDDAPPATLEALDAYAEASSGGLVLLAVEALGVRDEAASAAARDVGTAYALTGLLRAVPFHAAARRLYLPADLIAAQGIDVDRTLFTRKPTAPLAAIVEAVADRARARLASARARRRAVPREALPALLPAVLAERALDQLIRARFDPFAPELARPDGTKALALTLAALRRRY